MESRLKAPNPELAGEVISLVEQETVVVDLEIDTFFQELPPDQPISLIDAAQLLRTDGYSFALAVYDRKYFPDLVFETIRNSLNRYKNQPNDPAGKNYAQDMPYKLSKEQVQELNHHPYIRTFTTKDIAVLIGAQVKMIEETCQFLNLKAAVPAGVIANSRQDNLKRYNKDQIRQLEEGITHYNAPEGYIPENLFLEKTNLTPAFLHHLKQSLEIDSPMFRNPESRQSERHLRSDDATRIIANLIIQRRMSSR